MKKNKTWLIIVSITFLFGVVATLIYVRSTTSVPDDSSSILKKEIITEIPTISYCELASQAEKYNGNIVRVKAHLGFGKHGLLFVDRNCLNAKPTAVILNPQDEEEFRQNLKAGIMPKKFIRETDATAVGRFKKVIPTNSSDALADTASLQFELISIE